MKIIFGVESAKELLLVHGIIFIYKVKKNYTRVLKLMCY